MMCRLSNFDARMLLVCSPPQTSLLEPLDELLLLDELDELCEDEHRGGASGSSRADDFQGRFTPSEKQMPITCG